MNKKKYINIRKTGQNWKADNRTGKMNRHERIHITLGLLFSSNPDFESCQDVKKEEQNRAMSLL